MELCITPNALKQCLITPPESFFYFKTGGNFPCSAVSWKHSMFVWNSQRVNNDWRRTGIFCGQDVQGYLCYKDVTQRLHVLEMYCGYICNCSEKPLHESQIALLFSFMLIEAPTLLASKRSTLKHTVIRGALVIDEDTWKGLIAGSYPIPLMEACSLLLCLCSLLLWVYVIQHLLMAHQCSK